MTAAALALMVAGAGQPLAQQAPAAGKGKALAPVFGCLTETDPARRLACFDREVGALQSAAESKKVVVLDPEQVRETRRSLFGFTLPSLRLFGGSDKDAETEMQELDTKVASIGKLPDDRVFFTVEGGARWTQTDDRTVLIGRIKPGTRVRIRRASLGSYFANIEGAVAFRARREN